MGHFHIKVVGEGMTQQDAEQDAIGKGPEALGYHESGCHFREVLRVKMLSAPKKGKPKVERKVSVLAPKWKRRWIVKWYRNKRFDFETERPFEKKTAAVHWAKEQIVLSGEGFYTVEPGYVLVSGKPELVEISAAGQQLGRWEFEMDFHH